MTLGVGGATAGLRKSNPSPGNLRLGKVGMVRLGKELNIESVEEEAELDKWGGGLTDDAEFDGPLDI